MSSENSEFRVFIVVRIINLNSVFIVIRIINLIYLAHFDTNDILTVLCIVIKYIQTQHMHIWMIVRRLLTVLAFKLTKLILFVCGSTC